MWQSLQAQKSWMGELINEHKDGHTYDVAVTITPIVDEDEEVTGFVSVHSDITRLKELERLKTEFIANVSHQLRTPLTNIKTYVSLLRKGKPEKFPRYFSVLHYEIDRLARLIQDLLDISRLDAQKLPNPDAAVNLVDFWDEFWPPFEERAERENRALQLSFPDELAAQTPTLFMEPYQLEKILSRLVENSLTYTSDGGQIQVQVLGEGLLNDVLKIQVCDDGPGILEEERPFIFDRFFRGEQAVESGTSGNGLGLAIVKELLDLYGGEITLESEPGEGTCFTLALPLIR
jgi:signal transduction histidine kinase